MIKGIETLTSHPIIQMCWVVDDLEEAAMQWVKMMGTGPFFFIPHLQYDDLTYRGKPATLDQSSAVCQWGTIQVELFQQHCQSPSGVRDMWSPGQSCIQHLTWWANDLDAETRRLEGLGFPTVMTCRLPSVSGMRMAWFDTRPLLGTMVEVYEESEVVRDFYRRVAQAAETWNGDDPIRPLEAL